MARSETPVGQARHRRRSVAVAARPLEQGCGGEWVLRLQFAGEGHQLETQLGRLLLVEFGDFGVEAGGHFRDRGPVVLWADVQPKRGGKLPLVRIER